MQTGVPSVTANREIAKGRERERGEELISQDREAGS